MASIESIIYTRRIASNKISSLSISQDKMITKTHDGLSPEIKHKIAHTLIGVIVPFSLRGQLLWHLVQALPMPIVSLTLVIQSHNFPASPGCKESMYIRYM